MLERASQWLGEKIASGLSNDITYKRGLITVSLAASRQRTTHEVINLSGMIIKVESHDFVIQASSLADGGTILTPQPQDVIEITDLDLNLIHVFEVQALSQPNGTHEKPYKHCDPWGHQLRIFTKFKESRNV